MSVHRPAIIGVIVFFSILIIGVFTSYALTVDKIDSILSFLSIPFTTSTLTFTEIPTKSTSSISPTNSTLPVTINNVTATTSTFQTILAKTNSTLIPINSILPITINNVTTTTSTGIVINSAIPAPNTSIVTGTNLVFISPVGVTTTSNPSPSTTIVSGANAVFTPQLAVTTTTIPSPITTIVTAVYAQCTPPVSGDWAISSSCTLSGNANAPANVIVYNDSILTIPAGTSLNINFTTKHLFIQSGSGILIKSGGKIF